MKKCETIEQGDLLSGKWAARPPRRGDGKHIRLTQVGREQAAVAGMGSFAGEGPRGKYCKDCDHFGEVAVQCSADTVEMNRTGGCVLYAQRMAHAGPKGRSTIKLCRACKYFLEADGASPRCFVVDQAGVVHRFENLPSDLRRWRPAEQDDGRAASPDAACSQHRER